MRRVPIRFTLALLSNRKKIAEHLTATQQRSINNTISTN